MKLHAAHGANELYIKPDALGDFTLPSDTPASPSSARSPAIAAPRSTNHSKQYAVEAVDQSARSETLCGKLGGAVCTNEALYSGWA